MAALRDEIAKDLTAARKKHEADSEKAAIQLTEERKISEAAKAQAALINRQIAELRRQVARLNTALVPRRQLRRHRRRKS